jgi:hypothetical protein
MNIEQKIINTALEFKTLSLKMGKEVATMNKEDLDQEYIKKQFQSPNKVIHKLFELLDEYEFSKGISKKIR